MTIEVVAKKVDDAIKQGLQQLGATLDQVTVEVVESGGLFSKAKVKITLDEEKPEKPAKSEISEKPAPAPENTQKAEKPEKVEKVEKPAQKAEKVEKTEKTGKTVKKSEKVEKVEKVEKTGKAEKLPKEKPAVKPLSEEKTEKGEPAQNPQKRQNPQKQKSEEKLATTESDDSAQKPARKEKRPPSEEEGKAISGAEEFIRNVVKGMGFDATVARDAADPERIVINAKEGDDSLIIGRHGEMLAALCHLAETAARAEKSRVNISLDCNGYLARRAASLEGLAHRRADEAVRKHRKIKFEPMNRADRRTIHCALSDDARVNTSSEGKEPYRCVVIYPARKRAEERADEE